MTRMIVIAPVIGLLLSGCTLGFKTSVEKLSYVKEEPKEIVAQYSRPGKNPDNSRLIGSLRLDFSSDTDLMALHNDDYYHISYEAKVCGGNEEINIWPDVYKNGNLRNKDAGHIYHYSIFLLPDSSSCGVSPVPKPEPICVRVRAARMVWFFIYIGNWMKVDRESICSALAESR